MEDKKMTTPSPPGNERIDTMCNQDISPARIIRAMRDCRGPKNNGQGDSYDKEAKKAAVQMELLSFVSWPAGYWRITAKGLNYIQGNSPTYSEDPG
jgi:hypothetical protein